MPVTRSRPIARRTSTSASPPAVRPRGRPRPFAALLAGLALAFAAPAADAASPDLVASLILGPVGAKAGDKVAIERTFLNFGVPVPGPFTYTIHLSQNTTITSSDPVVETRTGDLGHQFDLNVKIPESIPSGTWYWGLRVHPVGGETSTANNAIAGNPIGLSPPPAPDLAAVSIDGPLSAMKPGSSFTVWRDVADVTGTYSGALPFAVHVVLSDDTTIDSSDLPLAGSGTSTVLGKQALTVTLPASIAPGTYHLGLIVDTNPADANPADNVVKGGMIAVAEPDLAAKSIAGPSSGAPGDAATVTLDVDAPYGLVPSYGYQIRLSTNTNITASDPLVATGTSSTFGPHSVAVTIPASLAEGTYHWGLMVDAASGESLTGDNRVAGNTIVVKKAPPPPNLTAELVSGPSEATLGGATTVLWNASATDFSGSFAYEIRLSTNATITAFDPLVASGTASQFGAATSTAVIPSSLAPGSYFWGLIVKGPPGETTVVDNWVAGNPVELKPEAPAPAADLTLDDVALVSLDLVTGASEPVTFERAVKNVGAAGTVLTWAVGPLPLSVSVTPSSGSVAAGGSQPVTITVDSSGFDVGQYSASVKFENLADPLDLATLPVLVTVDHPGFVPGETLAGALSGPADVAVLTFPGVAGMKLKLKVKDLAPGLKLDVLVVSPSGATVEAAVLENKKKKKSKLVTKLPEDGEYRLDLSAADGAGAFVVKTKGKPPKKSKSMLSGDGAAQVATFHALAGAVLDAVAIGTKRFEGEELTLELRDAHGALLQSSTGLAAAELVGAELPVNGRYVLRVLGVVGKNGVKLEHELTFPFDAPFVADR